MLDALAAIDSEAHAQSVKAVLGAGVLGASEGERVAHAAETDDGLAALFELEIEEAEVEAGIVSDERRILEELEQFLAEMRRK